MNDDRTAGDRGAIDRRTLLGMTLGGGLAAGGLASGATAARAAPAHTLKLGDVEITVISDGHLSLPASMLATNAEAGALEAALAAAGQRGATVEPACNVTLVRSPAGTVLIDTGAGPHFMPTAGKLLANMEAAGIDPASVTTVVFTHAHPDHVWGTLDDFDNSPVFAKASYVLAAAEWNFWFSDDAASRLPENRQNFVPGARRSLFRVKDRIRTIDPGGDIAPGMRAIGTAGHTAGHIAIEIVAGREAVIVGGDVLTHPVVSFAHPEWRPVADHHDQAQAVASRKALLARLAADRSRLVGFHLPFPGIGRVEAKGSAFVFVPGAG